MRNGFKVWDTDTHIHPTVESLEPYFGAELRSAKTALDQFKGAGMSEGNSSPRDLPGRHQYRFPGQIAFKRILGQAGPPVNPIRNSGKFMGTVLPGQGVADDQVDERIAEQDREGVDVQLLVPGVPTGVFLMEDPRLEVGLIQAFNRFINDLCGKYPHRLKSLLVVSGQTVEQSVAEIRKWGKSSWAVGVWPFPGMERPLDHPDMEPIWAACADEGLCVVHHSLAWTPPYFPGYRDMWDNLFLGRACSHPWGAMRAVGSFLGSGILDRYSDLRFGVLECGCGWMPFWARHLDDQAEYVGSTAPLRHKISEYMMGGRFYSSIEMHEGEDMIRMVVDFMGDGILMYASDYPHPECFYPGSVEKFLGWKSLNAEQKRKLLWDNPVRFYGNP